MLGEHQSFRAFWEIRFAAFVLCGKRPEGVFAVVRRVAETTFCTMTKLAEIQEAILRLDPKEQQV